jgi:hypothetical protein
MVRVFANSGYPGFLIRVHVIEVINTDTISQERYVHLLLLEYLGTMKLATAHLILAITAAFIPTTLASDAICNKEYCACTGLCPKWVEDSFRDTSSGEAEMTVSA